MAMVSITNLLKGALSYHALLIFLASCTSSQTVWEASHVQSCEADVPSCKIVYPCLNEFNGLALEFIRTPKREQFFILLYSFPVEQDEIDVYMKTENTCLETKGYVFEGGQKIALNNEASQYLFKAFCANQSVTIRAGRFHAAIPPDAFHEAYQKGPPLKIPIEKYF